MNHLYIERISCNVSEQEFKSKYIDKRKPVILQGCQKDWKAKDWTIENLLQRYDSEWATQFCKDDKNDCRSGHLHGKSIQNLIDNRYRLKVFDKLLKSYRGWVVANSTIGKVDMLDEYAFPDPLPKDMFENIFVETDQAYIMLSTNQTGNNLYIKKLW